MTASMRIALMLALFAFAGTATADRLGKLPNGLHTWTIDGTSDVRSCCFTWHSGDVSRGGCALDGRSMSISTRGDCAAGPGAAQVYVRVAAGRPTDVWLLSSNCPVDTAESLTDHGLVSADDSMVWFRGLIEDRGVDKDVREEAMFALVLSESDAAFRYLDRLLTGSG